MKTDKILLGHGSGGQLSNELINKVFIKHFSNKTLDILSDACILKINQSHIAFTSDSFVVDPIFFLGGNIGKLAICGTVNDIAVSGAKPLYLSTAFIIEEGFSISKLEEIVKTMAEEAKKAGIKIVTGDTKVVNKGKCDKIFINTTGIGSILEKRKHIGSGKNIKPGDKIIINGSIGDHGIAVMSARNDLKISSPVISDCACLHKLIEKSFEISENIKFMRDATRGGLASILAEIVENKQFGIEIEEENVPVKETVRGMCELLGFDPFYVANEGKFVMIVEANDAEAIVNMLRTQEFGSEAAIIGEVVDKHHGKTVINTSIGGQRILDMLSAEQLPRIC
ncbi:MAG: hydrogenase expression/formation protein HypE [Bacteroidales bacterium]|jgi:hydrogenase expression/formation protein HypE|nr:hydrogenase expression/formation protein HypE [Bacteroidales bacterium]MCK9498174.1 hydrogenase expression/formation protein HypE [Bacteroidales bacterium]MDY0313493.1 hydrogenase expression/formation protein HypE [Bacteroidales bacterium]NLB87505.1 hydrogenase expression/formation protein HypE [Bacteroidales bacterium]